MRLNVAAGEDGRQMAGGDGRFAMPAEIDLRERLADRSSVVDAPALLSIVEVIHPLFDDQHR